MNHRWLVFWLAAVVLLAVTISVAWPEAAMACALVVMTIGGITGLFFCVLWTVALIHALRSQQGVTLFFLLFDIGKIAVVLGGSLLFLFAVLFTLGLAR